MTTDKRIKIEKKTISKMISLYCKDKHKSKGELCEECEELFNYSMKRLGSCRFGENKPACGKCKIHCYKPEMRMRIIQVMRKVGPKMLIKHPILTIDHLIQTFKKK